MTLRPFNASGWNALALLEGTSQITTVVHRGLQHHPLLHSELIGLQTLPELTSTEHGRLVSKKTQVTTHVETEDRHLMDRKVASSAQHRSITTQHHRQVGKLRLRRQQTGIGISSLATHGQGDLNPKG